MGNNKEALDMGMLKYCSREEVRENYKYLGGKELVEYQEDNIRSASEIVLPVSFKQEYFEEKNEESKETTFSMVKR